MLVLSRKAGEKINIGEDITVEVRRVAGNRVTIALSAPRDVRILRGELSEAATEFEVDLPVQAAPSTAPPNEVGDDRPSSRPLAAFSGPRLSVPVDMAGSVDLTTGAGI
ncbi:hypothetical protein Mal64_31120 [Pseudobythopirellula maris]|uniref:Translational regulator CsrA n=1 Tax=Pseudobythopirellula maris TaxID=2527991 RepID=A0A5C5ZK34_9BACT|nr:carbon storage regulator [Pseudobythopirellula maris]TWT87570.1 hypothetical protein Mal64_31120 [Pseudobythopirellula maris]